MGSGQKYSLRWNDFSMNVATTFRDLHSRQDFVDVTLALSDGSTLGAHKVILSSVSTYFREILKTAECKHPILILKDTGRDEASAMLEFAYTGEVNVGQELLPTLLHTAKCFKIKGLDNVETPPGLLDLNTSHSNDSEAWGSRPGTRSQTPATRPQSPAGYCTRSQTPSPHSPTSVQSNQDTQDLKFFINHQQQGKSKHQVVQQHPPPPPVQHPLVHHQSQHHPPPQQHHQQQQQDVKPFISADGKVFPATVGVAAANDVKPFSDHFLANSLPATNGHSGGSHPSLPAHIPRTPRSQPATRPSSPLINSRTPPPKRWKRSFDMAHGGEDLPEENGVASSEFRESKRFSTDSGDHRFREADSVAGRRFAEPRPIPSYPHSTPASPTMIDSRNFQPIGLLRHLVRLDQQQPREAHENSRIDPPNSRLQSMEDGLSQDAIDYRFQTTEQSEAEVKREEERQKSLSYRPESAPTVLDMSPEATRLSIDSKHESVDGLTGFRSMMGIQAVTSGNDLVSDCLNKSLGSSGMCMEGGAGRYSCDECGKLFRHPGSLQHHRHIHRGTHRCPSCGKAFSRRWDMERHLKKSKYGCPANRFGGSPSATGAAVSVSEGSAVSGVGVGGAVSQPHLPPTHHLLTILPHSTQTNSL